MPQATPRPGKQTVWVTIAQDNATGEVVAVAAGMSAKEAKDALQAELAEAYAQLVHDVGQPPLALVEWLDSLLLTEPEAVQVAS